MGKILKKNKIRDKVFIATKLPHYLIHSAEGMEKLFQEQLARLETDHIDYYLMHMLTDTQTWERLKLLGILKWLEEKKKCGAIRQIGFSYHGNSDILVKRLPEKAKRIFATYPVRHTPAQWAFRWLWNQPEITCVLSGMNSVQMVRDNIRTASTVMAGELGPEEEKMLRRVVKAINARMKVGCTGCGYCMPCPKNVDIPGTFAAYNRRYSEGKFSALKEYFMCTAMRKTSTAASNCIECGRCEKHCPQHIAIRAELKNAREELEVPVYKIARRIVQLCGC